MTGPSLEDARRQPSRPEPHARVPPHNLQAEESLLGAMLLTPTAIDAATNIVTADSYYKPAHGHIHQAILQLHQRGEPADVVTVADQLTRNNLLDAAGGTAALVTLSANTPATTHAHRYAQTVADMATLRRLIAAGGEIAQLGYDTPDDVAAAVDQAEHLLQQIADTGTERTESRLIKDHIPAWLDRLEQLYEHGEPPGIRTGLTDLDNIIVGLQPGQLIIVAARPSMGKSAWGFQVATHAATNGHCTLLVNIEMGTGETLDRIIGSAGRVDLTRLRTGKLREQDWPNIGNAVGTLDDLPLWEYNDPSATLNAIRAEVRRRTRDGLALVVVDYLQLMTAAKAENRQIEVADLSKGLRNIARTFNVAVVALAQLSRNLEMRANKRPILADLRESGQIEQDAHVVIGIYRDEVYNDDTEDRGVAELIVLKQRNGGIGVAKCAWLPHFALFANMARV